MPVRSREEHKQSSKSDIKSNLQKIQVNQDEQLNSKIPLSTDNKVHESTVKSIAFCIL